MTNPKTLPLLGLTSAAALITLVTACGGGGAPPASGPGGPSGGPGQAAEEWDGGSSVPCQAPLRWRLVELDQEFGLERQEAEDAVRLAGMLWEDVVDSRLFVQDPDEGFPIRFLFDEEQVEAREREVRQEDLEASARAIRAEQEDLAELREELARAESLHDQRLRDYDERLEAYQEAVDYWNRQGGAPEAEGRRLNQLREVLEGERRALEEEADGLNRLVDRVNAETERLNRRVAEHNRARRELQDQSPARTLRTGTYRESRRTLGGRVLSLDREIRIHHFRDRDHLILVLAHEMGHALGLGHSEVPGGVMVDAAGPRSPEGGGARLHSSDVDQLRERCPDL